MSWINKNSFIILLIPAVGGILSEYLFTLPINSHLLFSVIIVFGLVSWMNFQSKSIGKALGSISFIFLALLCIFIVFSHRTKQSFGSTYMVEYEESNPTYLLKVLEIKETGFTNNVVCRILGHLNRTKFEKIKGKLLLSIPTELEATVPRIGDNIIVNGLIEKFNEPVFPEQFSFKNYYRLKGIHFRLKILFAEQLRIYSSDKHDIIFLLGNLRNWLLNKIELIADNEVNLQILNAMILGEKGSLEMDTRNVFINSGVMHILAVSGLHVGIIYLIIKSILKLLRIDEKRSVLGVILVLVGIWFYAALTGFSPSVSRAAFMFSLITIGGAYKRRASIFNILACSAFSLLLLNPLNLFDVGFQLSYSALLGIVSLFPILNNLFYFKSGILTWLWSFVSVTLGAQIGTIPISLYYFNQFPNYFIINNLLAVPAATIILVLGIASIVFSAVTPLFLVLKLVLNTLINLVYGCLSWMSALPGSVSYTYMSWVDVITVYIIIAIFLLAIHRRSFLRLFLSLLVFLGWLTVFRVNQFLSRKAEYSSFVKVGKSIFLDYSDKGDHSLVLIQGDAADNQKAERYLRKYWIQKGIYPPKPIDLSVGSNEDPSIPEVFMIEIGNISMKYSELDTSYYKHWICDGNFEVDFTITKEFNGGKSHMQNRYKIWDAGLGQEKVQELEYYDFIKLSP